MLIYPKYLSIPQVHLPRPVPTYDICTEAEQITGTIQMVQWWEQDVVNEPEE